MKIFSTRFRRLTELTIFKLRKFRWSKRRKIAGTAQTVRFIRAECSLLFYAMSRFCVKAKENARLMMFFSKFTDKYHFPNESQDGNTAVLNVLKSHAELQTIIEKYIKGTEKINWQTDLESAGIEMSKTEFQYKIKCKIQTRTGGKKIYWTSWVIITGEKFWNNKMKFKKVFILSVILIGGFVIKRLRFG